MCAFLIAKDAVSSRGQRGLQSDYAEAQADLNLRCVHMFRGTFSDVAPSFGFAFHTLCNSVRSKLGL